jgi:hypothetical protein
MSSPFLKDGDGTIGTFHPGNFDIPNDKLQR